MKKLVFKYFIFISFFVPMAVSCVGLDEVWDKIDSIEAQLDSIQNDLNAQMDALASLMSDGSTISSCVKNNDGSYVVTLSNGTKFTVLPNGTDVSALVSCLEVDGVKCWATYGADGQLVALKDAKGNVIPVDTEISVEVKDGKYVLIVAGQEYVTGYDSEDVVSVFSSCTPHKDASGQIYAMTFTFGDGVQVTVTVDGYKGVIFKLSNAGTSTVVSEYFLDYKATQTFTMDIEGVVDYVMQIPDGWRVEEYFDELTSETYIDITAPAKETIEAGAAVTKGDLKVVSVVEGGKAAITKLSLSTDPFKVYNVTSVKALIEPYKGIEKFVYGLTDIATFDEAQLVSQVNELLKSTADLPKGVHVSEVAIDKTLAEIYGSEIPEESNLMFWVVPALYEEGNDELSGGYYVKEDMLRTLMLAPIFVDMNVSNATVLDADLVVNVRGADLMYAGTVEKSGTALNEIIYQINNNIIDPVDYGFSFNGKASQFPSIKETIEMKSSTSYISWIVPVDINKKEYLTSDIIYKEFSTLPVQPGGSIELTTGDATVDCSYIGIPVSSENAAMIYYAWLSDTDGKRFSQADNATKMSKLQAASSFNIAKDAIALAELDFAKPNTTMWLFAVAVGHDGKYGEVVCKSATTEAVSFNSLTVSISEVEISATDAIFDVAVTGGTASDYIYWCGKETEPFWLHEEYCNNSTEDAEEYMAANPDANAIVSIMKRNGNVSSDGKLTVSSLDVNSSYILIVLAKDESGKFSKATVKRFKTDSMDLGADFVAEGTDKWNSVKKLIEDNITWHKDRFAGGSGNGQGSAEYAFSIKIPKEFKSYISCFGPSDENANVADVIMEVEQICTKMTQPSRSLDEDVELPTWENELDGRQISTGGMFNYYVTYLHGDPNEGCVTLFSEAGHDNCEGSGDGHCTNYMQFKEHIAQITSFDYWYEYISYFANQEKYGRKQSNDAILVKAAEEYAALNYKYFANTEPIVYVNDGTAVELQNRNATGIDQQTKEVVDKVIVVLVDAKGNYYAPMYINVPNYFK